MELFAIELNVTRLAQFIVNCLAVGGGFLAGYVLMLMAGWLLDRFLFRRKTPHSLHMGFRYLGGTGMAILVALIVFGHGQGWTLMGGGLEGTSNGTGNTETPPTTTPATVSPTPVTPPPSATSLATDERLRITMLGGSDVKEQRFYQLEDDPQPITLSDLKAKILQRKDGSMKTLGLEIRFATRNALPQDHPAVGLLTRWARETAALPVTFPAD
jgi:hypothetical protein